MEGDTTTATRVRVGIDDLKDGITSAIRDALQEQPLAPAAQEPAPSTEQAPAHPVLARLHQWSAERDTRPPDEGDLIKVSPDRIDILSQSDAEVAIVERARMGQTQVADFADNFDEALGLGVPWGSIVVGAIPGAITGEVIDGVMPARDAAGNLNAMNLVVKGGTAAAAATMLPRWIGKRPALFFSGALAVQLVSDLLPLDRAVNRIVGFFDRTAPASQAWQPTGHQASHRQATPINLDQMENPILSALGRAA